MFRTALACLSLLALTIIVAIAPARAGEYYSGDGYYGDRYSTGYHSSYYYGDRYHSGYRTSRSWSDCCYRKVVRYEKLGGYYHHDHYSDYGYPSYRSSYYYGHPYYRSSYYYGRPYNSGYYGAPRYYTSAYYGYNTCAPRRLWTANGWVWSAKAGCPQTRW